MYVYVCIYVKLIHTVNEETFCWAELSWYPQYMDFRGNTFVVQGQGTIIMFIRRAKDS